MGGGEVAIEPAGGLEDGSIGTDAERVRAAVERVRSPDGVLVRRGCIRVEARGERTVQRIYPCHGGDTPGRSLSETSSDRHAMLLIPCLVNASSSP